MLEPEPYQVATPAITVAPQATSPGRGPKKSGSNGVLKGLAGLVAAGLLVAGVWVGGKWAWDYFTGGQDAGSGSSESRSASSAPVVGVVEARQSRSRIDTTISNNVLLGELGAISLPEVAKDLRAYTNALSEGDYAAARNHCEAALGRLKGIPEEFKRGTESARFAGKSIVNLLRLSNDAAMAEVEADYYQKIREEYAGLRGPPAPGRIQMPRGGLAFDVIRGKYPTLRSLTNQQIMDMIRERVPFLAGMPDENLVYEIQREADNLVPVKRGLGWDVLVPTPSLVSGALEALARETRPTLEGATPGQTLQRVRAAISAAPGAWPKWLSGVWQVAGTTYVGIREKTLRFWKLGPEPALAEVDADTAAEAMMSRLRDEFRQNQMAEGNLITVMPAGSDVVMTDGAASFRFSPLEWRLLVRGHPLTERGDLEAWVRYRRTQTVVVYSHPMMLCAGPYRNLADAFCFGLQKAYPQLRVYRDPFSAATPRRVEALNRLELGRPSDYVAVIAEDSFGVVDGNVIQDIRTVLTNAGIEVKTYERSTSFTWQAGSGKGVIVITGHSSEELAAFVRDLGDSGALRGNFVIFNSCQTPVTRDLATRMVEDYGAEGAFVHRGTIRAATVQAVMVDLAKSLKQPGGHFLPDRLRSVLNAHGLAGVWTVSLNCDPRRQTPTNPTS